MHVFWNIFLGTKKETTKVKAMLKKISYLSLNMLIDVMLIEKTCNRKNKNCENHEILYPQLVHLVQGLFSPPCKAFRQHHQYLSTALRYFKIWNPDVSQPAECYFEAKRVIRKTCLLCFIITVRPHSCFCWRGEFFFVDIYVRLFT